MTAKVALKKIFEAKQRAEQVRELLRSLGQRDEQVALTHRYAEAMSAGVKFPPVTVFYDGDSYWLAEGFHRVKAAYAAGFDSVLCDVHQGTIEEAQWYSFSANRSNGLRRTTQDKQRAVKAAIMAMSSFTERKLPRRMA